MTRVYDVGDAVITTLTPVGADGTTVATLTVYRPDGTSFDLTPGALTGGTYTSPFWTATDDGTEAGPTLISAGDWLAIWKLTGPGAGVTAQVFSVSPLPGTSTRPAWSPFLSDVADWVPWLTVDTRTPGDQYFLGTFTGWTSPTDDQAQRHVDSAVTMVGAKLGAIPATLYRMARAVAALRAAIALMRAFPRNRGDLDTADALEKQLKADTKELADAADEAGTGTATPLPIGHYPLPNWWGDVDL